MTDRTRLSASIMAREMEQALRRNGVDVDLSLPGWNKLLEGIADGVIEHLKDHEQALTIPDDTHQHGAIGDSDTHDHGGHVEVRRIT